MSSPRSLDRLDSGEQQWRDGRDVRVASGGGGWRSARGDGSPLFIFSTGHGNAGSWARQSWIGPGDSFLNM